MTPNKPIPDPPSRKDWPRRENGEPLRIEEFADKLVGRNELNVVRRSFEWCSQYQELYLPWYRASCRWWSLLGELQESLV